MGILTWRVLNQYRFALGTTSAPHERFLPLITSVGFLCRAAGLRNDCWESGLAHELDTMQTGAESSVCWLNPHQVTSFQSRPTFSPSAAVCGCVDVFSLLSRVTNSMPRIFVGNSYPPSSQWQLFVSWAGNPWSLSLYPSSPVSLILVREKASGGRGNG